jgi:hypothetical protein
MAINESDKLATERDEALAANTTTEGVVAAGAADQGAAGAGGGQQQAKQPADYEAALADLQRQLDEERRDKAATTQRAQQAEQDARQAQAAGQTAQDREYQARHAAVSRAIDANKATLTSLKQQLRDARQQGDIDKEAEITEQIGRLGAEAVQLETGKGQLEQWAANQKAARAQQQQQQLRQQQQAQGGDMESALQRYTPRTQDYIRKHPELLRDPKLTNLATSAHFAAVAAGHIPDSDAYFDALDTTLGYKQTAGGGNGGGNGGGQRRGGLAGGAAAPGRAATPGQRQETALDVRGMSDHMRQLAKEADMKPEDWLKQYNSLVAAGDIQPIH